MQVPDTVQGIIAARLDHLDESLKRIVQVAAVIGREFAFRILETISDMKEELKSGLVNLQGLEFIYEKSLFPELEYIFKHAMTQEVAYNSLLLQRRKEIHERIGQAIEELYPHRLEEFYEMLAWHYSHSNNQGKACQFLKLSGQKATRRNSHREAFRLFGEALEFLFQMPKTPANDQDRLEVLRLMTVPMRPLGYPEGSAELLRKGKSLAKDLADHKAVASFLGEIGNYYMVAGGDPTLGKTYAEKGLSASELIGEIDIIAPVAFDLVLTCLISADWRKVCEVAPRCIKLIEKTGTQSETFGRPFNIHSLLKAQYGYAMGAMGNFQVGERLLRDSRECTHQISTAFIELYHGVFYIFKGDGKEVVKHLKTAAELCEKGQVVYLLGLALAWAGYGYVMLEQPGKALENLEKGLGIHIDHGVRFYTGSIHASLALAHLQLGNYEKAQVHARQGVNLSRANNERHFEALSETYLGIALGKAGRASFAEASGHILRGIEKANEIQMKPFTAVGYFYLGELNAFSSRTTAAMEQLQKAAVMFQEMGMDYWLGKVHNTLSRL